MTAASVANFQRISNCRLLKSIGLAAIRDGKILVTVLLVQQQVRVTQNCCVFAIAYAIYHFAVVFAVDWICADQLRSCDRSKPRYL